MSKKFLAVVILLLLVFAIQTQAQQAQQTIPFPKINLDVGTAKDGGDVSVTLQILLMMTILSLAPSIVIMTTSYLRIIRAH